MQVILYNCSSAPNVVHKRKSVVATLNGTLKENTNRESVVLTIGHFENWSGVNYAYIPDFKRYYFVSIDVMNGLRLKLTMKSDALSSFWADYSNSQCIAKRSSSNYNPLLRDDVLAFKPQPIYIRNKTLSKFNPSSSGGCYILTLGGK